MGGYGGETGGEFEGEESQDDFGRKGVSDSFGLSLWG